MKRRPPSERQLAEFCAAVGPDDGVDPRDTLRRVVKRKGGRKAHQLCRQVAEAINYALAAVCQDDLLREMTVAAVQPSQDESRLLVLLAPCLPGPLDPQAVLERVQQSLGRLKAEVASGIHRKRMPDLVFRVVNAAP